MWRKLPIIRAEKTAQSPVTSLADMVFVGPDFEVSNNVESECANGAEQASCGETVVQTGVFGESFSSLCP